MAAAIGWVIVDHKPHPGSLGDGLDFLCQAQNFSGSFIFGAELDHVSATGAELPGDFFRWPAVQVSRIDKSVKAAFSAKVSGSWCPALSLFLDQFPAGAAEELLDEIGGVNAAAEIRVLQNGLLERKWWS